MKILPMWKCENYEFLKQNNKNTETTARTTSTAAATAATFT